MTPSIDELAKAAEMVKRLKSPFLNKLSDFPFSKGYNLFEDVKEVWGKERREAADLILSLSSRVENARREALEDAANYAHNWLKDWAHDLFDTRDEYIEAVTSGKMAGRSISKENASMFSKQFRERAEAVDNCAQPLADAIRNLIPGEKP